MMIQLSSVDFQISRKSDELRSRPQLGQPLHCHLLDMSRDLNLRLMLPSEANEDLLLRLCLFKTGTVSSFAVEDPVELCKIHATLLKKKRTHAQSEPAGSHRWACDEEFSARAAGSE